MDDEFRVSSQRKIHYNKDWNNLWGGKWMNGKKSQRKIHYNKDWNNVEAVIPEKDQKSQRKIHYNKDWNQVIILESGSESISRKGKSTTTRIETPLTYSFQCNFHQSQRKIHYNKDWNPLRWRSSDMPWLLSQRKIHYNKDWNPAPFLAENLTDLVAKENPLQQGLKQRI